MSNPFSMMGMPSSPMAMMGRGMPMMPPMMSNMGSSIHSPMQQMMSMMQNTNIASAPKPPPSLPFMQSSSPMPSPFQGMPSNQRMFVRKRMPAMESQAGPSSMKRHESHASDETFSEGCSCGQPSCSQCNPCYPKNKCAESMVVAIPDMSIFENAPLLPVPRRTRFVSPIWRLTSPDGINIIQLPPNPFYFNTIAAALQSIYDESPVIEITDPYTIYVYGGTYEEELELMSNVDIIGVDQGSVFIDGSVQWHAGSGLNSLMIGLNESLKMTNISINANFIINVDNAKNAEFRALFEAQHCEFSPLEEITLLGRESGLDHATFIDCMILSTSKTEPKIYNQRDFMVALLNTPLYYMAMTLLVSETTPNPLASFMIPEGGSFFPVSFTSDLNNIVIQGAQIEGEFVVSGAGNFVITNASCGANWTLEFAGTVKGYIMNTTYPRDSISIALGSSATYDRTWDIETVVAEDEESTAQFAFAFQKYVNPSLAFASSSLAWTGVVASTSSVVLSSLTLDLNSEITAKVDQTFTNGNYELAVHVAMPFTNMPIDVYSTNNILPPKNILMVSRRRLKKNLKVQQEANEKNEAYFMSLNRNVSRYESEMFEA